MAKWGNDGAVTRDLGFPKVMHSSVHSSCLPDRMGLMSSLICGLRIIYVLGFPF